MAVLGDRVSEAEVVAKYMRVLLPQFDQLALAIETMLDMGNIAI